MKKIIEPEEDVNFKIFVMKYKNHMIYTNNHCHFVSLGGRKRYFHAGGLIFDQIERCKKEVDDFQAGLIK